MKNLCVSKAPQEILMKDCISAALAQQTCTKGMFVEQMLSFQKPKTKFSRGPQFQLMLE